MAAGQGKRLQRTREQIRNAAQRLFLRQGYQATSTDAILAEAGIASKETLYRHYANKEELFVDVLSHLTLAQPRFEEERAHLSAPDDLPALRQALTLFAREILTLMSQPEYLGLLRIVLTETPRFPQLGALFRETVPERGIALLTALLRHARARGLIVDVDLDAVARMLLGGLLTYVLTDILLSDEGAQPPPLERADAVVELLMRSLTQGGENHD